MQTRTLERPLVSNGYTLSMEPRRLGWLQPTDPRLPMAALREKYREQGCLWLKGILDREEVLAFRRHYFEAFRDMGLLAEGSDPVEGIYAGSKGNAELIHKTFVESVRWPEYLAFCTMPRLWKFYEAFLEDEPFLLTRKLIRWDMPGEAHCTPGHYDLIYLRAGTDRVCSSWIPIGDVPVEMGGLIYLEGSDALGREMEAEFSKKNAELPPEERINAYNKNMSEGGWIGKDLAAMAEKFDARWLVADYEAGDMVVHSPYMIHAATTNCDDGGRIRLSTDIRYQRRRDSIDQRWLNDWFPGDRL